MTRRLRPNVLQHQYAISSAQESTALSTSGIFICTAWYGWDAENEVSFLCHFDRPRSAESVPQVLRDLRAMVPQNHNFRSVLVGGKEWAWSRWTRAVIHKHVNSQTHLNIRVREGPVDGWLLRHRNLLVSPGQGHSKETWKAIGRPSPKGVAWFFKPMVRVRPDEESALAVKKDTQN